MRPAGRNPPTDQGTYERTVMLKFGQDPRIRKDTLTGTKHSPPSQTSCSQAACNSPSGAQITREALTLYTNLGDFAFMHP